MAEETKDVGVDGSNISPLERRNSLEKHLQVKTPILDTVLNT